MSATARPPRVSADGSDDADDGAVGELVARSPHEGEGSPAALPTAPSPFRRSSTVSAIKALTQGDASNPGTPRATIARRGTIALGIGHAELLRLHSAAQRQSARVIAKHKSIAFGLLEGNFFELHGAGARSRSGDGASLHSSDWDDEDDDDDDDLGYRALDDEQRPLSLFGSFRKRVRHPSAALAPLTSPAPAVSVAPRLAEAAAATDAIASPPAATTAATAPSPSASSASLGTGSAETLGVGTLGGLLVLCGCACQAPCDLLNSRDRGCADLISFAEYLYGVAASAPAALRERTWRFPLAVHLGLALTAVGYTFFLNAALQTPLPLPVLHTLKNGNLVANMLVGLLLLRRRYSHAQIAAVAAVTAGLVLTAASGKAGSAKPDGGTAPSFVAGETAFGIGCLCCSLLSRALTGALQEWAFARHGRASVSEVLFMRNVLALPFFAARLGAVAAHASKWRTGDVGGLLWPLAWVLLAVNLVMDFFCKVLMTRIIGASSALTATLVLTLQKFLSFALTLLLLSDPADPARRSPAIWLGSCAVLLGTTAYSTVAKPPAPPVPAAAAGQAAAKPKAAKQE